MGTCASAFIPLEVAWKEVTGENADPQGAILVLYVDDRGEVWRIS